MTEHSWSCCFPFTLWFAGLLGGTLGQRGCFLASLAEAARVQVTSKAAGSFQTLQITLAPSEAPAWSLCPRPRSSQVKVVCDISTASFTDRLCDQMFELGEMLASSTRLLWKIGRTVSSSEEEGALQCP